MAQTKKVAPAARPAKAPAKGAAKPPKKEAEAKRAPKPAPKAKAKPEPKAKKPEASSKSASKAPKSEKPTKAEGSSVPAARPSSKAVAPAAPSSRAVSAKIVAPAAPSSRAVSAKVVAPAAPSSRAVSAKVSTKDVSAAAKPAPQAVKAPEPKMPEPEFGTYRTRPPPPMPRIAAQSIPAPSPPPPRPPMPPAKGYQPIVNIQPFPRSTEPLNLVVGDKAVHPLHGLGEVSSIEHREVGGVSGDFYILRILDKGMRVMVPKASATSSGLRAVMSEKDANAVLDTLRAKEVAVDLQPWSRRFRAYTEMMKSGSPHEVAKVLRDMFRLKFDKDLSFGERRLLDQAKSLLMKELAAAKQISEADLLAEVSDMFKA
jgi:CarD family transcriptional regulator